MQTEKLTAASVAAMFDGAERVELSKDLAGRLHDGGWVVAWQDARDDYPKVWGFDYAEFSELEDGHCIAIGPGGLVDELGEVEPSDALDWAMEWEDSIWIEWCSGDRSAKFEIVELSGGPKVLPEQQAAFTIRSEDWECQGLVVKVPYFGETKEANGLRWSNYFMSRKRHSSETDRRQLKEKKDDKGRRRKHGKRAGAREPRDEQRMGSQNPSDPRGD